jgi:hypothetical protein
LERKLKPQNKEIRENLVRTPVAHSCNPRRVVGGSQPGEIVHEILSQKYPSQKRTSGVTQGVGPEFKPQC